MAKDENKRLPRHVLAQDRAAFAALQAVAGYSPSNPEYSLATLRAAETALDGALLIEAQAEAALAAARDTAVAREWEFHNSVLGSKDQVVAQFGRDSSQVQALGLKRASERRRPGRRTPPPPPEGEAPTP